jgi:hypothetical protein
VVDVAAGAEIGAIGVFPCITSAAISHDDTTVAVLGCDGELALLDLTTLHRGEPWTVDKAVIGRLTNDRTPGAGLTFAPGDEVVIASREDGHVEAHQADAGLAKLWSFKVGEHAGVPEVHDGMVWVGTSYGLGTDEITGGMVAMPLDAEALVELARATVTRRPTKAECERYLTEATC